MKSMEVYALLKSELAPWFKSAGFKRAESLLSWSRPEGDSYIVVWCQVSRDGWDQYAGSQFVVEFQRSSEPVVGAPHKARERLASFLTYEQREETRRIQNNVIASLQAPPKSCPNLHVSPEVTKWYLAKFVQVQDPYVERQDIWFRYASSEHVSLWAHFILRLLPGCINAIQSRG